MRVSTILDSIFGVPKTLGIIFRGQQRNSGMDNCHCVLKVREYPPGGEGDVVVFSAKRLSLQPLVMMLKGAGGI